MIKSPDGVLDLEVKPPKEMGGPGGSYTNLEQFSQPVIQHVSGVP
ncbi:hypothetical protein [Dysgonomonas termitidis]|uniref:Uncharacterized protein n=1 Tax=Dysgonomonas termitidis TaxID=1516126 RepID=A0ABV9L3T9_9BACT